MVCSWLFVTAVPFYITKLQSYNVTLLRQGEAGNALQVAGTYDPPLTVSDAFNPNVPGHVTAAARMAAVRSLAFRVAGGANVRLMCGCLPEACHADAIKAYIDRFLLEEAESGRLWGGAEEDGEAGETRGGDDTAEDSADDANGGGGSSSTVVGVRPARDEDIDGVDATASRKEFKKAKTESQQCPKHPYST